MVNSYQGWLADGSPWKAAVPVQSLSNVLKEYGFTVYILGNKAHLTANPPEDHTPYSHTPWPGAQPYPYVLAEDIMPGGEWSIDRLGAKIFADKQAEHPGLAGLKYMNWTDSAGNCWHDKWTPNHERTTSTDRGHIHLSWRTDFVTNKTYYDPIGGLRVHTPTAPVGNYTFPILNMGDRDGDFEGPHDIQRAQALLNTVLGLNLTCDGNFGGKTQAAVKQFMGGGNGTRIDLDMWVRLCGMSKGK